MTFNAWGFIYLGTGSEDPQTDRSVIETGGLRTTIVAVADRAQAPSVAAELVAAGAQSVELCGAFGPVDVAAVLTATGHEVPIGAASYGMESVPKLAALFS